MLSFLSKFNIKGPCITWACININLRRYAIRGLRSRMLKWRMTPKVSIYPHYERNKYHDISLQLPKLTQNFNVGGVCNSVLFSVDRLEKPWKRKTNATLAYNLLKLSTNFMSASLKVHVTWMMCHNIDANKEIYDNANSTISS